MYHVEIDPSPISEHISKTVETSINADDRKIAVNKNECDERHDRINSNKVMGNPASITSNIDQDENRKYNDSRNNEMIKKSWWIRHKSHFGTLEGLIKAMPIAFILYAVILAIFVN